MMDKKHFILGGATLTACAAIGLNIWEAQGQSRRDRASLQAQRKLSGRGPEGGMQQMAEDLGLSASQKTAFEAAQKEMRRQMEAMRAKNVAPDQAMALMDQHRKKLDAILTAEQREKMRTLMVQRGPGGPGGPSGPGGPQGRVALPMPGVSGGTVPLARKSSGGDAR